MKFFNFKKLQKLKLYFLEHVIPTKKLEIFYTFERTLPKVFVTLNASFIQKNSPPPPRVHVLEIRSLYVISKFFCQWHGLTLSEYRIVWFQLSIPDKVWGQYFGGNKILNMWLNPATTSLLSCFCKVNYSLVVLRSRLMQNS